MAKVQHSPKDTKKQHADMIASLTKGLKDGHGVILLIDHGQSSTLFLQKVTPVDVAMAVEHLFENTPAAALLFKLKNLANL